MLEPTKDNKKEKKSYPGINIQWPISELILSGEKTIETRTYPIPAKYLNTEMVLIETPGPKGKFKARTRAIIKFTDCFKYESKEFFYLDIGRHKVAPESLWAWSDDKPKWGWEVAVVSLIPEKINLNQKTGIVFTKNILIK